MDAGACARAGWSTRESSMGEVCSAGAGTVAAHGRLKTLNGEVSPTET